MLSALATTYPVCFACTGGARRRSDAQPSVSSRGKHRAVEEPVNEDALNELLHSLQIRIVELETVNASQASEIADLQAALRNHFPRLWVHQCGECPRNIDEEDDHNSKVHIM